MKLKRDTKFGEELTRCFKIDVRNLTNFYLSTQKSQNFLLLWAPFNQSVYLFELKKLRGVIFHDIEE